MPIFPKPVQPQRFSPNYSAENVSKPGGSVPMTGGLYSQEEIAQYSGKDADWWRNTMGYDEEDAAKSGRLWTQPEQLKLFETYQGHSPAMIEKRRRGLMNHLQFQQDDLDQDDFTEEARNNLAMSALPAHDFPAVAGRVNWMDESDRMADRAAGYYHHPDQSVTVKPNAGHSTLVHELGHRKHLAEADRRGQSPTGYGSSYVHGGHADPHLEGVAAGYQHRYAGAGGHGYAASDWADPIDQAVFDATKYSVAETGNVPSVGLWNEPGQRDASYDQASKLRMLNALVSGHPDMQRNLGEHAETFQLAEQQVAIRQEPWKQGALFHEARGGGRTAYARNMAALPAGTEFADPDNEHLLEEMRAEDVGPLKSMSYNNFGPLNTPAGADQMTAPPGTKPEPRTGQRNDMKWHALKRNPSALGK